jgi:acyl-coenzyme A synthetase/AMP-(fatty) acid ligase
MLDFPVWTGIGANAATVWHAGGCLAFSGRKDRFGDFFRHRPTHAVLVPAMLPGLLEARPEGQAPLVETELRVTGGFLPLRLAERLSKEITPKVDVYYGSTEACAFLRSRFRTADDLSWLTPTGEIEVVEPDGKVCAPGVEGEVRIRLMEFDTDHYMDDPETTAKFFRDGCFYPGDVGVTREDGRIRILGRIDDVINLAGFKVPTAPIEERIQRTLGADSVCVYSSLNRSGEEEVLIAVEKRARPADDVLAGAVKGFAQFERVRWVFLESFPRTAGGMVKVDRRKLRKLLD